MSDNDYCPIAESSNQISRSHSQIRILGRRMASIFGIVTSFRRRGQRKPFCRVCAAVDGFPLLCSRLGYRQVSTKRGLEGPPRNFPPLWMKTKEKGNSKSDVTPLPPPHHPCRLHLEYLSR